MKEGKLQFNSYTTNNIKSTDAVKKGSDTFRGHFDITGRSIWD